MKSNLPILLKRKLYIEHIFPVKTHGRETEKCIKLFENKTIYKDQWEDQCLG